MTDGLMEESQDACELQALPGNARDNPANVLCLADRKTVFPCAQTFEAIPIGGSEKSRATHDLAK
jgi:hypothetical protein